MPCCLPLCVVVWTVCEVRQAMYNYSPQQGRAPIAETRARIPAREAARVAGVMNVVKCKSVGRPSRPVVKAGGAESLFSGAAGKDLGG
jgi:hypothetical protein